MTAKHKRITAVISQKKGRDYYYIIVSYYLSNGKRVQRWIKTEFPINGNNKRKLEQKRIEVLQEWQDKLVLDESEMLFSDYLKQWLEETKYTISKNTYYSYKQVFHNVICPYFAERKIKICDLKPYHIQDFYTYKLNNDKVTANTIHHYHANISKALRYAYKMGRIESNPADKVDLPKKNRHVANFYTVEELKALLKAAKGSPIEPVVLLASWFGLRRGEIIGLRWQDIDFTNKILYINGTVKDKGMSGSKIKNLYYEPTAKTSSSIRSFPMSDSAVKYLSELKTKQEKRKQKNKLYIHTWDDFVCVRPDGSLLPLEYVSRAIPKLCEKAGLKRIKLHELRHTNISILLESGASMKELQEWAGHSSYSTTANIYSHIQAKSKTKLTESLENMLS